MTEFQSRDFGGKIDASEEHAKRSRSEQRKLAHIWTSEPAVVTAYYPKTQRVDVKLKNDSKNQMDIMNVPILHSGGDLRIYRSFKTTTDPYSSEGDIGVVLFPRTDSTTSYTDRKAHDTDPGLYHKGLGPVFIPGPLSGTEQAPTIQDLLADPTNLDTLNTNDCAIVHQKSGAFILFKEDGTIVIKGKAVYIGDFDDDATNFKKLARVGDGVTVGGNSGSIDDNSSAVYGGDATS